jgi:hypothetical protein
MGSITANTHLYNTCQMNVPDWSSPEVSVISSKKPHPLFYRSTSTTSFAL